MTVLSNPVLICSQDGRVTLETRVRPKIADGEILVRMQACGICGTDMSKVHDPYFKKPQQLGHELVATVVETKSPRFKPGQRVAIAHHAPDYNSHYTKRGSAPMDPVFKSSNIDPAGFAEIIRVPALLVNHTVIAIPPHVPTMRAVFMEPLACCLRAMDRVSLIEGDTAVIIGAGAVGILFVPLLRDLCVKTLVLEMRTERLQLAMEWGAQGGSVVGEGNIAEIAHAQTDGRGADVVILNVVTAATMNTAMETVRDGGTILIFASKPDNNIMSDWWEIWRREINLVSSYSTTPELLPRAMALLSRSDYPLETLVSHEVPLADAARGFALVREGKAGKVVICNSNEQGQHAS